MEGMWATWEVGVCLHLAFPGFTLSLGFGVFYSLSSSLAVGNQLSRLLVGVGTYFPRVPSDLGAWSLSSKRSLGGKVPFP